MKALSARHTVSACYVGYITQAIVNNFAPLLFLTFRQSYGISLTLIGAMITLNFGVQLLVDLLSAGLADKIGYRSCMIAAHLFAGAGLLLLALLPNVLPVPAVGLFVGSAVYAVGGGLIEVLVSPVLEACPSKNKKAAMSLLHSFYCWGQVAVVALSTLYFFLFGIENWAALACIWAAIPVCNALFFAFVPLYPLVREGESAKPRALFSSGVFWLCVVLMVCAGSSELAVSQWASAFAEAGLDVSKGMGDLFGPCMFALFMGLSRLLFSLFGQKLSIRAALLLGSAGCVAGYLLCAFAPIAWLALAGCSVVGFSVGVLWPGTFSLASARMPKGGTALFAFLALAGDLGCAAGPSAVGAAADILGGDLRLGIALGLVFPLAAFVLLCFWRADRPSKTPADLSEKIS